MKDEYRLQTNLDVYSDNSKGSYSDDYVNWLENKLEIIKNVDVTYIYECKVCGKPFGDKLSLREHYEETHN
jgi:hypothetical protein